MRTFRKRFPGVEVRLHEMNPATQVEALLAERVDVGFVRGPIHEPALVGPPASAPARSGRAASAVASVTEALSVRPCGLLGIAPDPDMQPGPAEPAHPAIGRRLCPARARDRIAFVTTIDAG